MSNPALAAVTAAEDAIDSSDPSYASSILDFPNAEAGPSNYASPSNPAGALQALAPVRASGQDEGSGVVMLPTAPNVFTDKQLDEYKEQDRYLPIANVGRIMKNSLPDSAKIAKEAKECVQECVSEFISFLSSEAADKVQTDKRKTINGEDILYSMTTLGFDNYAEACKVYLAKYRTYVSEHIPTRVHSRDISPVVHHEPEDRSASEDMQTKPGGKRARPAGGATGSTEDDSIPQQKRPKGPASA